MKSVLISIQPKWCEFIASGKKTVEVRKTRPKLETPFKVYIYCTKSRNEALWKYQGEYYYDTQFPNERPNKANGKVIGEFVCDEIIRINYSCGSYRCEGFNRRENDRIASGSQLSLYDMRNYLSCNGGYAWHITDLVVYDKPKELSEFVKPCNHENDCFTCDRYDYIGHRCYNEFTRPPQSWCYVERSKS